MTRKNFLLANGTSFSANWSVFIYICSDLDQTLYYNTRIQIRSYRFLSTFFTLKNISVSEQIGRFGAQLKSDRSWALLLQFHSIRGNVLLRLEQWTTIVAIMAIMSIFAKTKSSRQQISNCKGLEAQKSQT